MKTMCIVLEQPSFPLDEAPYEPVQIASKVDNLRFG